VMQNELKDAHAGSKLKKREVIFEATGHHTRT
jgi:hypothetical protein